MFFVISGYLISKRIDEGPGGLLNPSRRVFYIHRAARILPMLGMICLMGTIMYYLGNINEPGLVRTFGLPAKTKLPLFWVSIATFWLNIYNLWLGSVPGLQWIILWSLAIEEQFYFFYPMILKGLGRPKSIGMFLMFVISVGIMGSIYSFKWFPCFMGYHFISIAGFELIAMGCSLYLITKNCNNWIANHKKCLSWGSLIGIILVSEVLFRPEYKADALGRMWGQTVLGLGLCMFILGALQWEWMEKRWIKWVGIPGRLSYGMYLLHPMAMYLLWSALGRLGSLGGYILLTILTFVLAHTSERYFETPVNRWIRKTLRA